MSRSKDETALPGYVTGPSRKNTVLDEVLRFLRCGGKF
jgi:hypothetical protein